MTDCSNDSFGSLGMQFYHRGHREDTEEDLAVPLSDDNRQIDGIVVLLIARRRSDSGAFRLIGSVRLWNAMNRGSVKGHDQRDCLVFLCVFSVLPVVNPHF